jgi:hypothetical protein
MALIIDPPSGWKYGFPKPIPEDRRYDSLTWLVEEGYPQHLIDDLGEHFFCRYWEVEDETIDKYYQDQYGDKNIPDE